MHYAYENREKHNEKTPLGDRRKGKRPFSRRFSPPQRSRKLFPADTRCTADRTWHTGPSQPHDAPANQTGLQGRRYLPVLSSITILQYFRMNTCSPDAPMKAVHLPRHLPAPRYVKALKLLCFRKHSIAPGRWRYFGAIDTAFWLLLLPGCWRVFWRGRQVCPA